VDILAGVHRLVTGAVTEEIMGDEWMMLHDYIVDPGLSVSRGPALEVEPGLGELTLAGFLRDVTTRFADREAAVLHGEDGSVERWSYADLWERSRAVGKALVARGLGKGERVGIVMTNRLEFLSAVFGTALAGGVAAPLSTFSTSDELEYLIAASACSVLLLERQVLKKDFAILLCEMEPAIGEAPGGRLASLKFPFLRALAMTDADAPRGAIEPWERFIARGTGTEDALLDARAATVRPADPGVLFFSSGSTSKPKGILSAHRGVSIQMWRMARQQGITDDVRYWTANGFFWSGNFSMAIGATLASGGALILQRTFDPVEALQLMAAEGATFLFAWPHQWQQLIEAPNWAETDLSALRYIDVDSPIAGHPTVHTTWIQPTWCYGNTETFTLSTAYPANTTREVSRGSHGLPLPGNCIKIVDPMNGTVMPLGERGEIAVKGPTLMLGYLGTPLTEALDDEGYFRTGDGGWLDGDGRLHWEGRLNDIIKTGGANVSPVEIDDVIQTMPGVKVSQTVGIPHDTLGELVVTCIVPQEGGELAEAEVRAFARQRLASYKVPRQVLFFAESDLAMTGSAKVKTADLRALVAKALAAEQ
jgi:fatty-acyl-CoA synthase